MIFCDALWCIQPATEHAPVLNQHIMEQVGLVKSSL